MAFFTHKKQLTETVFAEAARLAVSSPACHKRRGKKEAFSES